MVLKLALTVQLISGSPYMRCRCFTRPSRLNRKYMLKVFSLPLNVVMWYWSGSTPENTKLIQKLKKSHALPAFYAVVF